jgi:FkbM family methyltransferase
MRMLINRLPITRIKLFLGRMLYHMVHLLFREDRQIIVRSGIKYEVDLSEGMDLSMFVFGSFQKHVYQNAYLSLPQDAVVLDVGANAGIMTLQFAKQAPSGKVYSFEPTFYAYAKFTRNLELNPELAKRVVPIQSFVSSTTSVKHNIKAYASWKVGGKIDSTAHIVHGGVHKSVDGIGALTLDDFCEQNKIERVDFIKIDTDGHELEVLKGAEKTIRKLRPTIIFEIGLYVMEDKNISFTDYFNFFNSAGYSIIDGSSHKEIDAHNYRKYIPSKGTIDIIAVPLADKK